MKDKENLGYQKKIHCVFSGTDIAIWVGIGISIALSILVLISCL